MKTLNSYLFVFSKPINKTDISRGELLSLIILQNKEAVIRIESIEEKQKDGEIEWENFEIHDTLGASASIFFLTQSAIVFSNCELDIQEIIRRSGYIQSCGNFLFLNKWGNLSAEYIENRITKFCEKRNSWHDTVFYKKTDNKLKIALDELLIDDKRYHIKNSSFNIASKSIKRNLDHYQAKRKLSYGEGHIFIFLEKVKLHNSSILSTLYEDRNIVDYGICYLSEYKKDNPIHEMDDLKELKPFWAGIFTTPHRLMNAMLNLAQVNEDSTILDPFCHTGTLAIEASQIGCKVITSDICGSLGAKDNYDFLCKDAKVFKDLVNEMESLIENDDFNNRIRDIIESGHIFLNEQGLPETKENGTDEFKLISERLYFYIRRRYSMETLRGADLPASDFREYIDSYINGIKDKKQPGYRMFAEQLMLFEKEYSKTKRPIVSFENGSYSCFIDDYYRSRRVGYINPNIKNYPTFQKNDICSDDDYNIQESSIDAVVTDPPYGYGESLSKEEVEEIYSSLITKSIYWLKPNGFIVFCALDKVKTGREDGLNFTEDILNIINRIAKKESVKFIFDDVLLTSNYLKSVYYWKSKSALNRSIISIQIIK